MKTTISLSTPAQLETESLVAVVLDHSEKDQSVAAQSAKNKDAKPQLKLATGDAAVQSVAAELLASGEVSGKPFEVNLLHKPAGLESETPAAHQRWTYSEEVFQLRSAPHRWSRRAHP